MTEYMNRDDVKRALHVEETPIDHWPFPKQGFDYTKEYNACNWQSHILFPNVSMVDIYMDIVPQLDRTWIYNGNTVCLDGVSSRSCLLNLHQSLILSFLFDEIDRTHVLVTKGLEKQ